MFCIDFQYKMYTESKFRDLAEIATTETETQPLGPVFDVEQEYTNET